MSEEKNQFYKCSIKLLNKLQDVRIAVLGYKIYFRCKVGEKINGYTSIREDELSETIYVDVKTIRKYIKILEEIKFLKTKRYKGYKWFKVNPKAITEYFE